MPWNPDPIIKHLESCLLPEPELQIWTGDKKADGSTPAPTPSSSSSSPKTLDKLRHYINKAQEAISEIDEANQILSLRLEKNISNISQEASSRQNPMLNIRMI